MSTAHTRIPYHLKNELSFGSMEVLTLQPSTSALHCCMYSSSRCICCLECLDGASACASISACFLLAPASASANFRLAPASAAFTPLINQPSGFRMGMLWVNAYASLPAGNSMHQSFAADLLTVKCVQVSEACMHDAHLPVSVSAFLPGDSAA